MPLLKLETTAAIPDDKKQALLASLSKTVGETLGKPQQYMMVAAGQLAMQMAGAPGEAAFVDIRSIGALNADVNKKVSNAVCKIIHETLGIPQNRIYLNFTDVPATHWGWNGGTFA